MHLATLPATSLLPRSSPTDPATPNSNGGLSGRSLAILVTFLCVVLLLLVIGVYRRTLRTPSSRPSTPPHRPRRRHRRPILSEVVVRARTADSLAGAWKSMQPLAARIDEPPLRPGPPPRRNRSNSIPTPPIQMGPGSYVLDFNAVIGDGWFGPRNLNDVPRPPPPPRRLRPKRKEPSIDVVVLVAMPTPRSSTLEDRRSRGLLRAESSVHDHPPQPPHLPEVAIGTVTMPWRQREDTALWNLEGAIGILT